MTYGTFRPGAHGDGEYPVAERVTRDFALMRRTGVNAVRTYTPPPAWLLDLAREHGLRLLVGLPWEQHVAFLEERARRRAIERAVREQADACAGHPAVACVAVGNEIPAQIVRWHGRRRVEWYLERLYCAVKEDHPETLVTYVNYPSTEYLRLPFLDVACFNVYLEAEELLTAYLARLQNLAGGRPLVMTELGLDSRRNGCEAQAIGLGWQVRAAFAAGCAGAFVFSWTDEWHRGGCDVDDWDFGLVDRERTAKPALAAVRDAFANVPVPGELGWPSVSVVVCTHNGAATLRECLEGVAELDYPDFECIVVDDGSTDGSGDIAGELGARVIRTEREGLGNARNRGLEAARGELVAYLDDDARPDRNWLTYLATSFMSTPHAALGGPNIPPEDETGFASCVARAPGGPNHVLVSDREAEHVPGCNMVFRRGALEQVGGFDPRFRAAGDDVDICWRLHERGWTIGFVPAAFVWHRRRRTLRAFLRQQHGYGEAEALLEQKWPEKYNGRGHPRWSGRVYGDRGCVAGEGRWRVYYGTWGGALFQTLYSRAPGALSSLPLTVEWYLLLAVLAGLSVYEPVAQTTFLSVPGLGLPLTLVLLVICLGLAVGDAAARAWRAWADRPPRTKRLPRIALTALLCLFQPAARLLGRLRHGLTPWRPGRLSARVPLPESGAVWSERWRSTGDRLLELEGGLRAVGATVDAGGEFARWDLEARTGPFGSARLRLALEDHERGCQLLRFRVWPHMAAGVLLPLPVLGGLAAVSDTGHDFATGTALAAAGLLVLLRVLRDCGTAVQLLLDAIARQAEPDEASASEPLGRERVPSAMEEAGE